MGISTAAAAEISSKSSKSANMLAPGFRFHPTDEELVRYYLRRKVCGKGFRIDAISDIDIYKAEPWDLPSFSKLKTRDMEWYFFSVLDKKYGNGSKTNRATERGYWKTTGKDRNVYHRSQVVGMKKTLVYHSGRAPKGQRTNWVMHEYRLTDLDLDKAGIAQDAFVLCRVFQKSGSGPKNGERYGAPFLEEEWEDDELLLDPKNETHEMIDFDGDGYLDEHDLEQILGANNLPDASPLPSNTSHEDCSLGEVTTANINDPQNLLLNANKECELQPINVGNWTHFPASWDMDTRVVKHEFIGESSKSVNSELDFLLDEPFFDCNDLLYDSGFDAPNNSSLSMIDEYINFVNSTDSNVESFAFDQPSVPSEDNSTPENVLLNTEMKPGDGNEKTSHFDEQSADNYNDSTAETESDKLHNASIHGSDLLSPFVKHSTSMLGNLPAPPAFASDLSLKDATALGLHSLYHSSSSSHIAAGLIQIRDQTQQNQFYGKNQNANIIVSLGFSRGDDGSTTIESSLRLYPGKILAAISRSPFSFTFFLILILSIGFKLGICVSAK